MKRIAFLINDTISKKNKKVAEIINNFSKTEFDYQLFFSRHSRHIELLAYEAVKNQYEYIIVLGGDGSLNEALNGLIQYAKINESQQIDAFDFDKIKGVKLGIFPCGSGNDFARFINIGKNVSELKNLILNDSFKACDIGFTKFLNIDKEPESRFFINIADVGMGGVIAQQIRNKNKSFIPSLFYIKAIIKTLLTYKNSKARYSCNGETWEGDIMGYIFANGKFFGSGLGVAPDASLHDNQLNIIRLGNITVRDYIYHLKDLKRSKHIKHKEVFYSKTNKLKIESVDQTPLPIDMDGEFVGYAPLEIMCLSNTINILQ